MKPKLLRTGARCAAVAGLVAGLVGAGTSIAATPALAQSEDCTCTQRGEDPTEASIEAETGPFKTATVTISAEEGAGFGGGTIYHPSEETDCPFGALILMPGLNRTEESIAWYGPRIASQGFVVLVINGENVMEGPTQRVDDFEDSIKYLTGSSAVKDTVDADRIAIGGHSFGGGGALNYAKSHPEIDAVIPLSPSNLGSGTDFSAVTSPTVMVAMQNDELAPPPLFAKAYYDSIPGASGKAYLEFEGAAHELPLEPNTMIAKSVISWMKRFVDSDGRYDEFLWPVSDPDKELSANEFKKPTQPAPDSEECQEPTPEPEPSPEPEPEPGDGGGDTPGDDDGQVGEVPEGAPETGGGYLAATTG